MDISTAKLKIRENTNTTTSDYSDASLIRDLNSECSVIRTTILAARGPMEFDDPSYTDVAIATFSVASNGFCKITEDEDGNLISTIHKVGYLVGGKYVDVPRAQLGEGEQEPMLEAGTKSVPSEYYEIGNSIVFPGVSGGTAKIWFDRELSTILTSDTTKELPVPPAYHNLACYRVSLNYRIDKSMDTSAVDRRIMVEEAKLEQYEANRRGDEATVMTPYRVIGL
jgi:hypothetical protein